MSAAEPAKAKEIAPVSKEQSGKVVRAYAANELVFAVVGHVGSGTSQVAMLLKEVLEDKELAGGRYDVSFLKARDEIMSWARGAGKTLPTQEEDDLCHVTALQNLGDAMRLESGDDAAVARALVEKVRVTRAKKLGQDPSQGKVIIPDGQRRAYILDSIRHPAEVHLLRQMYQSAFSLVGVVCDEEKRLQRIMRKYKNAGEGAARGFMKRDAKAAETHGQRVSDTFHMSDYFLDNTADRLLKNKKSNPNWDIAEQLSRLIKIITHITVERPTMAETAMYTAYGAQMRSACLSRQVGAVLVDRDGNIVATGTNEVPKGGGGLYGEGFDGTKPAESRDDRCAYRRLGKGVLPYCSNTQEQNEIIDELIRVVPQLSNITESKALAELKATLMQSRIGGLLEFSRAVHAEMDALLSAARQGVSPIGARLFVTTFPCHYCARHIVSAGVDEVQYIEPYPKSQALKLHEDSITPDSTDWKPPSEGSSQVLFRPFTGVAPRLYARAFLKDRDLKNEQSGVMSIGEPHSGSPWYISRVSYPQLETELSRSVPAATTNSNPRPKGES